MLSTSLAWGVIVCEVIKMKLKLIFCQKCSVALGLPTDTAVGDDVRCSRCGHSFVIRDSDVIADLPFYPE